MPVLAIITPAVLPISNNTTLNPEVIVPEGGIIKNVFPKHFL